MVQVVVAEGVAALTDRTKEEAVVAASEVVSIVEAVVGTIMIVEAVEGEVVDTTVLLAVLQVTVFREGNRARIVVDLRYPTIAEIDSVEPVPAVSL